MVQPGVAGSPPPPPFSLLCHPPRALEHTMSRGRLPSNICTCVRIHGPRAFSHRTFSRAFVHPCTWPALLGAAPTPPPPQHTHTHTHTIRGLEVGLQVVAEACGRQQRLEPHAAAAQLLAPDHGQASPGAFGHCVDCLQSRGAHRGRTGQGHRMTPIIAEPSTGLVARALQGGGCREGRCLCWCR